MHSETITGGRSGSPVFSSAQKAVVGMIDYQGGELHKDAQIGAAIPIEAIVFLIKPPEEIGRIVEVPELPVNFLCRPSDLKGLKDALMLDDHPTTAITSLSWLGVHGMGGIGKSVLAVALARDGDVRSHFSDGIFWLTLGIDPKIALKQAELARMIDCEPHPFENSGDGRSFLGNLLADKTSLVILDDVWAASDVQELLSNLGSRARMLITTRDARIITALAAREYPLGLLSPEESKKLLADWAGLDAAALALSG